MPPSIDSRALDLPPFRPRFPWLNADLQTVAVLLGAPPPDLSPHRSERLCFCLGDASGDILLAMLDRPAEPEAGRPLVVLVHGLTGCETSPNILSGARHLLGRGYPVLRLNLRGCGASRPYCHEHYHIGRTADLRQVLWQLPEELARDGIVVVGYSMGGAMLLKMLGEDGSFSPLRAAATICAPLDLKSTGLHMMRPRNWLYHAYVLNGLKKETLAEGGRLIEAERDAVRRARTIHDFDERFIAPRYGFRDADDYYDLCNPLPFLPEIRVPTMVLAAADDPWIPAESYRDPDWGANPWLVPVITEGGGHLGFHCASTDGPWCDLALEKFLARLG
ncbi:MAG: alpha/beta fold hydrolase [Reyranellaceae bacterium]